MGAPTVPFAIPPTTHQESTVLLRTVFITTAATLTLLTGCGPCYHDTLCDYVPASPTSVSLFGETIAANDLLRGADVLLVSEELEVLNWATSGSTGDYEMDVEQLGDHWIIATYEGFDLPHLDWQELVLDSFGGSRQSNLNLEPVEQPTYAATTGNTGDCSCEGSVQQVSLICCNAGNDCWWEWGTCD